MADIIIYTANHCPYCTQAKQLLDKKAVAYTEIPVDGAPELREKMIELSGRRTVPQIFINDKPIGGFDDLWQLEKTGALDLLISD